QPVNGMNQLTLINSTEDPIKKLTLLMEELVVSVKNNNNKTREIYNENRSNFCKNHSTVTCFACRRPGHISWECPDRNQDSASDEPIIEVYATKRKKGNDGKPTEVKTSELNKKESKDHVHKERKVIAKRRKTKPVKSLIMSNIQPYSVMTDLQNKKADITYAQLLQVAPNIRKEIMKITRAVQVKGHPILLIIDSGSSRCVVFANFLKEVRVSIDRPLTVLMIGVHGEQKCPLGKVDEFSVMVGEKTITSCAVISDARNYAMGKKIKIATEYCKLVNIFNRIQMKTQKLKAQAGYFLVKKEYCIGGQKKRHLVLYR
ncbi:3047_t:CDS:2, partial [Gigaspora margarita]